MRDSRSDEVNDRKIEQSNHEYKLMTERVSCGIASEGPRRQKCYSSE